MGSSAITLINGFIVIFDLILIFAFLYPVHLIVCYLLFLP